DIGPGAYYIWAMKVASQTDIPVQKGDLADAQEYLRRITERKRCQIYHLDKNPYCWGGYDSTATGIWCHLLLGTPADDDFIRGARAFLEPALPTWRSFHQIDARIDWNNRTIPGVGGAIANHWYWMFGALAFRSLDCGREWLDTLDAILLKHQRIGGMNGGSWDPVGLWAVGGGRTYSTAFSISALQAGYAYSIRSGGK
ncbi:MAG: hypothetical protein RDV41_09895, partial [Planctomycetota bacterium]|nr:hypothetical protein [Planctomycetota bacterium]